MCINNNTYRGYFDRGSSINVAKINVLNKTKIPLRPCNIIIKVFGGVLLMPKEVIKTNIQIDDRFNCSKFGVR